MLKRATTILTQYDTEPMELLSGLIAIGWGILLLFPFGPLAHSDYGEHIKRPEMGCVMLIYGVMQLGSLLTDRDSRRAVSAFVGASVWMFAAVLLWQINHEALAVIFMTACSLYQILCYVRLRKSLGTGIVRAHAG